jgi:hypothetical protein
MQRLVVLVLPDVFGVVAIVEKDGAGIPVELFLRKERAAFKDKDALARLREVQGESPAASAGSDDDGVVVVGHGGFSSIQRCGNRRVVRRLEVQIIDSR